MKTFEDLARTRDSDLPVVEGALLIAREEYPDLDLTAYGKKFEELARRAGRKPDLGRLNEYFFEKLGFRGNREDYYDPRNSYLNQVLDRRTGIPIALSAVYVEIARRIGLPAHGVAFPGHYLVRCEDALVDCFNGITLDSEGCQELLDSMYGGSVKLSSGMLRPSTGRETLRRMLNNLRGIYMTRQVYRRALRFAEMSLALSPESAEALRDRGLIHIQMEDFGKALADLERYLREAPDAPDAGKVREHVTLTRRLLSHLN